MAVIINEFEVIPEPAQQQSDIAATQSAPAAQNTLPQEVDSVLRLRMQRAIRVRAE